MRICKPITVLGFVLVMLSCASLYAQSNSLRSVVKRPSSTTPRDTATKAPAQRTAVTPSRKPTGGEARLVGQIESMAQMLERHNLLLQRRLAQADQLRQMGLKKEDKRLLDQAEELERQALAAYEQQIKQFETYSARVTESTKISAQKTVKQFNTANAEAPQKPAGSASPAREAQKPTASKRD